MTQEINLDIVHREYQNLLGKQQSLQMATLDAEDLPEASYAPFVWFDDACYLYLSLLAKHTQNLCVNPSIGLLLIEDQADARNQFARRRIIWQGKVEKIERHAEMFKAVMQAFRDRFGDFIDVIEPLQDFLLFKVAPTSGRYIRGFAQAYQLSGDGLNQFTHINPGGSQST